MDYLDIGFDFGLIMDFTLEEISQQRTLDKLSRQRLDGLSRQRIFLWMDYLDKGFFFGWIDNGFYFGGNISTKDLTLDKLSRQRLGGLSRQRNQFLVANAATFAQLQLAALDAVFPLSK